MTHPMDVCGKPTRLGRGVLHERSLRDRGGKSEESGRGQHGGVEIISLYDSKLCTHSYIHTLLLSYIT